MIRDWALALLPLCGLGQRSGPGHPLKGTLGHSGRSQSCSVVGEPIRLCSSVMKWGTLSPWSLHNLITL